jgi:hypothetical protein
MIGFALLSGLPPAALYLWQSGKTQGIAGRAIRFHPIGIKELYDTAYSIWRFFLPWLTPSWPLLLLIAAGAVMLAVHKEWLRKCRVCLLLAASYYILLLVSVSFADRHTPLDTRTLSPVFLLLLPAVAEAGVWIASRGRIAKVVTAAVCFTIVGFSLSRGLEFASQASRNGLGYLHLQWRNSPALNLLKTIPPEHIYSNAPDAIYFYQNRLTRLTPRARWPSLDLPNHHMDAELYDACAATRRGAVVVEFESIERKYLVPAVEIAAKCGLTLAYNFTDARVWHAR